MATPAPLPVVRALILNFISQLSTRYLFSFQIQNLPLDIVHMVKKLMFLKVQENFFLKFNFRRSGYIIKEQILRKMMYVLRFYQFVPGSSLQRLHYMQLLVDYLIMKRLIDTSCAESYRTLSEFFRVCHISNQLLSNGFTRDIKQFITISSSRLKEYVWISSGHTAIWRAIEIILTQRETTRLHKGLKKLAIRFHLHRFPSRKLRLRFMSK